MKTIQFRVLSAVASLSLSAPLHAVPAVVKLHDFDNTDILNNPGPQAPNDAPVLIGSKLWFTTEKGGYWGFGTLSTFDVGTFQLEEKLSMDNASGNTPKASPVGTWPGSGKAPMSLGQSAGMPALFVLSNSAATPAMRDAPRRARWGKRTTSAVHVFMGISIYWDLVWRY